MMSSASALAFIRVFLFLPDAACIRSLCDVSVPSRLSFLIVFAIPARSPTAPLKCLNDVNNLSILEAISFIASLSLPMFFGFSFFSLSSWIFLITSDTCFCASCNLFGLSRIWSLALRNASAISAIVPRSSSEPVLPSFKNSSTFFLNSSHFLTIFSIAWSLRSSVTSVVNVLRSPLSPKISSLMILFSFL